MVYFNQSAMKTMLAPILQSSGYPLNFVVPSEAEEQSPVDSLQQEGAFKSQLKKFENVTDTPEKWDETWFANYE